MDTICKILFLSALFLFFFSCEKEQNNNADITNYFKVDETQYGTSAALAKSYGKSATGEYEGYKYDLYFYGGNVSININEDGSYSTSGVTHLICFTIYSELEDSLTSGAYSYATSSPTTLNSLSFGYYKQSADTDSVIINSGVVTVSTNSEGNYVITYAGANISNNTISEYYSGAITWISANSDTDDNVTDTDNSESQVLAIVGVDASGGSTDSTSYSYNTDGLLIKTQSFVISSGETTLSSYTDFEYANGKLIQYTINLLFNGTDIGVVNRDSIEYDSNNKPAKIHIYSSSLLSDTTFYTYQVLTYNTENLLVKVGTFDRNNLGIIYDYYTYSGNNMIKDDNYIWDDISNGYVYTSQTNFEYDSSSNPYKGLNSYLTSYEFYNENNITKETYIIPEVGQSDTQTYTYEFNSTGYPVKITENYSGIYTLLYY